MKITTTIIPELPAELRDPMRREANRGLMVMFINRTQLWNLDVRKSIVLYDDAGVFEFALDELPDEATQKRLLDKTNVRYWSKGIA